MHCTHSLLSNHCTHTLCPLRAMTPGPFVLCPNTDSPCCCIWYTTQYALNPLYPILAPWQGVLADQPIATHASSSTCCHTRALRLYPNGEKSKRKQHNPSMSLYAVAMDLRTPITVRMKLEVVNAESSRHSVSRGKSGRYYQVAQSQSGCPCIDF